MSFLPLLGRHLPWGRLGGLSLEAAALLLGVVLGTFFLFEIAPGDAARSALGVNASEEAVQRLREEWGADRPLTHRLARYVVATASLDWGRSLADGQLVTRKLAQRMAVTLRVSAISALLSLFVSYFVCRLAFVRGWTVLVPAVRLGAVFPPYAVGIAVWVVCALAGFPLAAGAAEGGGLGAPVIVAGMVGALYSMAVMTRTVAERISQENESAYARSGRASGMGEDALFRRVLFPNVRVVWLSVWVNQLSVMFVVALVLEVVFALPGTGTLLLDAVQRKDLPLVRGLVTVNAVLFLMIRWGADSVFVVLDPRFRRHGA